MVFFIHVYPVKVNPEVINSFFENSNGKDKKMHFDSNDIMIAVTFYHFLTCQ